MKIDGSCHCGAITYEAEVDPETVSICHCTDCQTLTGTTFRTAVEAPEAGVTITGSPTHYIKIGTSGRRRKQGFCGTCGTPIYSIGPDDEVKTYMIRVGTARQRDELVPRKMIWCDSAVPWLDEIGGIEKVATQ